MIRKKEEILEDSIRSAKSYLPTVDNSMPGEDSGARVTLLDGSFHDDTFVQYKINGVVVELYVVDELENLQDIGRIFYPYEMIASIQQLDSDYQAKIEKYKNNNVRK